MNRLVSRYISDAAAFWRKSEDDAHLRGGGEKEFTVELSEKCQEKCQIIRQKMSKTGQFSHRMSRLGNSPVGHSSPQVLKGFKVQPQAHGNKMFCQVVWNPILIESF